MTKVVVLGAGIIGLWTAGIASGLGHRVQVISQSDPNNTTSAAAVCVLTPFFPGDPTTPLFKRLVRWAALTLQHVQTLDKDGIFLEKLPCYEFGADDRLEDDFPVTKLNYLDFAEFRRIDLPRIVAECDFAIGFDCHLCNTSVFIPWLYRNLRERGVRFTSARLTSLDDIRSLDADIIFNCLGLQDLFPDPELYPVLGQSMFVPVRNQPQPHFGLASGHHAVFKHRRGFYIGSYFLKNVGGFRPREDLYQRSIEFVRGPFPELCAAVGIAPPTINLSNIERVNNGVRPFRSSGPRVELDQCVGRTIVHNYGHGAHGWTLGYASAREAVALSGLGLA